MKRSFVLLPIIALAAVTGYLVVGLGASRREAPPVREAAVGVWRPVQYQAGDVVRTAPFLSGATVSAAEAALGVNSADERPEPADGAINIDPKLIGAADLGVSGGTIGCRRGAESAANVRVNQDCTFRRQAEESIIFNPVSPRNLLAGQNDSRVGFNQCGIDFSTDSGRHWGDMLPPFRQHQNSPEADGPHTIAGGSGTEHTYDAASDPAVAFDSEGRGFFSCVMFDAASNATGVMVMNSPKGAQGSFFFNVPATGPTFIVAEDNSPTVAHDKEFIAADHYRSSPNRDNVYVTWTVFRFDPRCISPNNPVGQCESPIFGSMSTDHARTWSPPELISGTSTTLCFFGNILDPNADPHACNLDQGSDPVVLPNGDLQVIFNNGNTQAGNPNGQQLGVHCRPAGKSTDGSAHLNCGSPSFVGADVTHGEPLCDFGRGPEECIPGPFIRTNDFPRISRNVIDAQAPLVHADPRVLYATWQDYKRGEFDIELSVSTDSGLSWRQTQYPVNADVGLDHYMPAIDIRPDRSDRVGVSYFRSERVPNENTLPAAGAFATGTDPGVGTSDSDYVLAGGTAPSTPFEFRPLSPVFPAPDGIQAGFNGDYSGLTISGSNEVHPIWSDTRNPDPYTPANGVVHDEDVFSTSGGLPSGNPPFGQPGRLGRR